MVDHRCPNRRQLAILLGLGLLSVCCGNAGTPLMWATFGHLFIGNAIIGVGEGVVMALITRRRAAVCFLVMIAANYISAWAGVLLLGAISPPATVDLYSWRWFVYLMGGFFLVATVLIEWPLIALLFRKRHRWFHSFLASLLVQCLSYAVLVTIYQSHSALTLDRVDKDPSLSFVDNRDVVVYYVGLDGAIYRQPIGSHEGELVARTNALDLDDRLILEPSQTRGFYDVWLRRAKVDGDERMALIVPNCTTNRALGGGSTNRWSDETDETANDMDNWNSYGPAADYRKESEREWLVRTDSYSYEGLVFTRRHSLEYVSLALDVPFLSWHVRNATVLPGDEIVFQLGQQICVYDHSERKVAVLAHGRGPVVVVDVERTDAHP